MVELYENDSNVTLRFESDLGLSRIQDKQAKITIVKPSGGVVELDATFEDNTVVAVIQTPDVLDEPGRYVAVPYITINGRVYKGGEFVFWVNRSIGSSSRYPKDNLKYKGEVTLQKLDASGNIVWSETVENMIVDIGKVSALKALTGKTSLIYMSIGSDGNPTTADMTDLGNKVATTRINTSFEGSGSDTVLVCEAMFSSLLVPGLTGTSTIQEAGMFFSDGTMFNRVTFGAKDFNWDVGESLSIIWRIGVI